MIGAVLSNDQSYAFRDIVFAPLSTTAGFGWIHADGDAAVRDLLSRGSMHFLGSGNWGSIGKEGTAAANYHGSDLIFRKALQLSTLIPQHEELYFTEVIFI